jgi:hypothetical protein
MSSKDSKWRTNLHGAQEYQVRRDWASWDVLWTHTKVGSWIANANHKQFFDQCVLGMIIVIFEDYNYRNEEDHIIVA